MKAILRTFCESFVTSKSEIKKVQIGMRVKMGYKIFLSIIISYRENSKKIVESDQLFFDIIRIPVIA